MVKVSTSRTGTPRVAYICHMHTKPNQELIHALHAPIVDRVVGLVNKAYSDTLPGLPYTELPVIPVTGRHISKHKYPS